MKKILLVALVAMLGMQPADAQRKGGNTRTPEQMVEKLDEKLNLTDEQENRLLRFIQTSLSRNYRVKSVELPCRN